MYQNKDKKNAEKHLENAGTELRNAKDSAVSAAKNELRDLASDDRVRSLRETARETGERVQDFLHERRDDVQHARQSAERTIRANPLTSAAIAFFSGVLLSRLVR